MSLRFLQADAFTSRPFGGNPAAVVLLDGPRPDGWLQLVAREFNLSETAFLLPASTSSSVTCVREWSLRWFTPQVEVDLCGHATLAAAHALREWKLIFDGEIKFRTRSGLLKARLGEAHIALNFPSTLPQPIQVLDGLPQVLGIGCEEIVWCGRSRFDIVLQLSTAQALQNLKPDFAALKCFESRGVCVTALGEEFGCDFVSRFFAPNVGIDEDPVTGSAHCALAPFWKSRLGKSVFFARQLSARGGELWAQVLGERVELSGGCVTVMQGELK